MLHRLIPLTIGLLLMASTPLAFAQTVEQLFEQGKAAQEAGNYTEAERLFRQAIQIEPNNFEAYKELGNVFLNQGKLEAAMAQYKKALEINPNYANAYNNVGLVLYQQGKIEEAIINYKKAIQLNPNLFQAYINLGIALSDQGKLEEAIANYQKAIQLNPNSAQAYINLGIALRNQGKIEEAIANYQKAIQLNPNYADAYYNLGNALSDQGKIEEAIANYQKAIQLNPNSAKAYNNLGIALSDQGKLEAAIANYQKAIQLNPNSATAYNNLGIALSDQGKIEEAIANYQKALSLPDEKATPASAHTLAHNNLGLALQQQGKLEEAIAEYQKSLAIDPNYVTAKNNLQEAQRLLAIRDNPPPAVEEAKYIPSEKDEPLVKVLRATVRIIALASAEGNIIGSGWVVKRQGDVVWVVTNRHVISDRKSKKLASQIEIEFFSELPDTQRPRYRATIEHTTDADDRTLDLAVLKVEKVPADIQPLTPHPGRVSRNARIRIIGHPYNVDTPWNSASGEVMNYNLATPYLPLNALVAEGNSGGPIIDEQQQVIGVMVTIRRREDVAIAFDASQASPDLSGISPATGDIGIAYRIDVVIEQLRVWKILRNRSGGGRIPIR